MLTLLLAKIPGSVFFKALQDGEPMAFVMLGVVVAMLAVGFCFKYMMAAQSKSE